MTVPPKLPINSRALVLLVVCVLCLAACDFYYQPLEVHWTVNGGTDPKACKDLGVKSWIVELIDTGLHAWTEVRCEDQKWTSGEAFFAMEADDETSARPEVLVDAVDDTLSVRASHSRQVDVEVNRAKLILIADIDFRSKDFGVKP